MLWWLSWGVAEELIDTRISKIQSTSKLFVNARYGLCLLLAWPFGSNERYSKEKIDRNEHKWGKNGIAALDRRTLGSFKASWASHNVAAGVPDTCSSSIHSPDGKTHFFTIMTMRLERQINKDIHFISYTCGEVNMMLGKERLVIIIMYYYIAFGCKCCSFSGLELAQGASVCINLCAYSIQWSAFSAEPTASSLIRSWRQKHFMCHNHKH